MPSFPPHLRANLPGAMLCVMVTFVAYATERLEAEVFGRAWLDALVIAILLGTTLRTIWTPPAWFDKGIAFSAKGLLEIAVALLGLSVSAGALSAAGGRLFLGVAAIVPLAIAISYGIGRAFRIPHRMALLIACGNSICGNSAIAAAAPVIQADGDDVTASIAFTAVLGVVVVLVLPLAAALFGLSNLQYGIFAGLTVYAVPQVVAATAPVSALSVQIGTLVKLVRVLMLAPTMLVLSLASRRRLDSTSDRTKQPRLLPWFILAFLAMVGLRTTGVVPAPVLLGANASATVLTVVAMAALGLGVDVRVVAGASLRVTAVVILSLLALAGLSLTFIALCGATSG